jgi:dipeptidyl aminopeptidase/acylaminoacyl peptidase
VNQPPEGGREPPSASLPRQEARTRRFTLGAPRSFTIAADGSRVLFLRSRAGDDPLTCLWSLDVATGTEHLVADPAALTGPDGEELPPEERVRRERVREQATGITAYATDRDARLAVFSLSGRLWAASLRGAASVRELPAAGPVAAAWPDPGGSLIAYVVSGSLRVIGTDGTGDRLLAAPEAPGVSYGLPEHAAAESMGRHRGFWWAPDGSRLLVARVDVSQVQRWYIGDPASPAAAPAAIAYPVVGTANADVTLWITGLDGSRVAVRWDRAAYEYVVAACWAERELLVAVQSRSQRIMRVLAVDQTTGETELRTEDTDTCWVQIVPGTPAVRTAVLLPSWHRPGSRRLPVLMDPYGGPAAQRVLAAQDLYVISQWFAEQGFAVVVADGRGTPGRGPAWEREIYGDLAGPVLEDQVAALHAAAERFGDLDLGRVGIRGWSFGGFLAALAVLRRPDVFHAAVAGAPLVDQRLYDTHFKERYLGHPDEAPAAYDRSSLIADAPNLRRPLMLIHGLADDNVVAANTLRLSAALLAAGRPHTVLPLAGVTHMPAQEKVAENLLVLQADFLKRALGGGRAAGPDALP